MTSPELTGVENVVFRVIFWGSGACQSGENTPQPNTHARPDLQRCKPALAITTPFLPLWTHGAMRQKCSLSVPLSHPVSLQLAEPSSRIRRLLCVSGIWKACLFVRRCTQACISNHNQTLGPDGQGLPTQCCLLVQPWMAFHLGVGHGTSAAGKLQILAGSSSITYMVFMFPGRMKFFLMGL